MKGPTPKLNPQFVIEPAGAKGAERWGVELVEVTQAAHRTHKRACSWPCSVQIIKKTTNMYKYLRKELLRK